MRASSNPGKVSLMRANMSQPNWFATTVEEHQINNVVSAYQYMAVFYSSGALNLDLLQAYVVGIITAIVVKDAEQARNLAEVGFDRSERAMRTDWYRLLLDRLIPTEAASNSSPLSSQYWP
jgi:hypothetical protein